MRKVVLGWGPAPGAAGRRPRPQPVPSQGIVSDHAELLPDSRRPQGGAFQIPGPATTGVGIDWDCDELITGGPVASSINGDGEDSLLPPDNEICGNRIDDSGEGSIDDGCGWTPGELLAGRDDWRRIPSQQSCLVLYDGGRQCYPHPLAYRNRMAAGDADCRPSGNTDVECLSGGRLLDSAEELDRGAQTSGELAPYFHTFPGPLRLDNLEYNVLPGLEICDGEDSDGDLEVDEGCRDSDGDGVVDAIDNCPTTPNADQADRDGSGLGDLCDLPSPVTDISVDPASDGVYVTWTAAGDDVLGFNVYRTDRADRTQLFLGDGYPSTTETTFLDTAITNPDQFSKISRYTVVVVNLNGVEGEPTHLELEPSSEIFADGFESGDTSAWSAAVP